MPIDKNSADYKAGLDEANHNARAAQRIVLEIVKDRILNPENNAHTKVSDIDEKIKELADMFHSK